MTNINKIIIFIGTVCHIGFFMVTYKVNSQIKLAINKLLTARFHGIHIV